MIDNRSGVQLVAAEGSAEELISIYSVEPSVVGWQVARWLFEHPEEDSHCRFMDSYNQLVRPHATKAQEVKGGLGTAGAWRSSGRSKRTNQTQQPQRPLVQLCRLRTRSANGGTDTSRAADGSAGGRAANALRAFQDHGLDMTGGWMQPPCGANEVVVTGSDDG